MFLSIGIGIDEDSGIDGNIPHLRWSNVSKLLGIMSENEILAFQKEEENILPFLKDPINMKILYLLVLSSFNDNPRSIRYSTAVLSTVFHLNSNQSISESMTVEPFLEKMWELKNLYEIGKNLLPILM